MNREINEEGNEEVNEEGNKEGAGLNLKVAKCDVKDVQHAYCLALARRDEGIW